MSGASPLSAGPPGLRGYRFLRHIGSGGNAQVYLYEQELPSRQVAVKVLNDSALSEDARRRFVTEANVTAVLAHRHIVQVFDAKVTDEGQPYIVMPYYPKPNLAVRARRADFSVPQVLRIGIQIGSAVETSHRHGVLHRDIKPQNILTDAYGDPALTDFGIATTTAGDGPEGLSVPWSPPEIIYGTGPGDQRSDVYSLGATLWHLLVGRPPFERPDGGNTTGELMERIHSEPPPRTQRRDVPDSLERLLRQAMAKDPAARPQSAMELIRGLQSIEQELRLPVTHPILPADEPARGDTRGDTVTRPPANGGPAAGREQGSPAVTDSPEAMATDATQAAGPGSPQAVVTHSPEAPVSGTPETGGHSPGPAANRRGPRADDHADPLVRPQMPRPEEPSSDELSPGQADGSGDTPDATIARGRRLDGPREPDGPAPRADATLDATRARSGAAPLESGASASASAGAGPGFAASTAPASEDGATATRGRTPVRLDPWEGAGHQGPGVQGPGVQGPGMQRSGVPVPGARIRQFPAQRPDAATVARSDAQRLSRTESASPGGLGPAGADRAGAGDADAAAGQSAGRSRRARVLAGGGGVLLAVAVAAGVIVLAQGGGHLGTSAAGTGQATGQAGAGGATESAPPAPGPPVVTARRVSASEVEFSWTYANAVPGSDTFRWQESGLVARAGGPIATASLRLAAVKGELVCLVVTARHADGSTSPPSSRLCWSK